MIYQNVLYSYSFYIYQKVLLIIVKDGFYEVYIYLLYLFDNLFMIFIYQVYLFVCLFIYLFNLFIYQKVILIRSYVIRLIVSYIYHIDQFN